MVKEVILSGSEVRISNKQIRVSVIVIISPRATQRRTALINDVTGGYLSESTVPVSFVKGVILIEVGNKDIEVSIEVIIYRRAAPGAGRVIHNTAGCYFGE